MSASPGVLRLLARPLSQLSPARPACRLLAVSSGPALNQLVPQIRSTRLLHSARSHCQQSDQAPPVKRSKNVDKDVTSEELSHFDKLVAEDKEKQIRTPWHREGSERPPVSRPRSAGAMVKGKLLTTPSRLLKLILPLTTRDQNKDRKDVEPLSLLVHPQQPLSYLERLIQSEVPATFDDQGRERIPLVNFYAVEGLAEDELDDTRQSSTSSPGPSSEELPGVESYSGLGREASRSDEAEKDIKFVRWSKSTEIGDFIRDAARGKEFSIEIQGAPREIRVGVPSFNDRTYYLRTRLRKKAAEISGMAKIKSECDALAHRAAQRYAYAGFGGMIGYGAIVYWLTFETTLGWDVMEPVTYLIGLAGVLGGYGWFLFNRREASYQSAMSLTVSKRQSVLYENRGFDLRKWQILIDEANALRKEILAIAGEYDVDWNESGDAQDEEVVRALRKYRREGRGARSKDEDDDDDDDDKKKQPRQKPKV